jgi:hypothetical protein
MGRRIALALVGGTIALATWTACVGNDPSPVTSANDGRGGADEECYSNQTCNPGFACVSGFCKLPDGGSTSSGASSSGASSGTAAVCPELSATFFPLCPDATGATQQCDSPNPICCPGQGCLKIGGLCAATGAPGYQCFQSTTCGFLPNCCVAGSLVDGAAACNTTLTLQATGVASTCRATCNDDEVSLCARPDDPSTCASGQTCRKATLKLNNRDEVVYVCRPT